MSGVVNSTCVLAISGVENGDAGGGELGALGDDEHDMHGGVDIGE